MVVRDAWVRVPLGGLTAAYFVIENGTGQDDVLDGVTLPGGGAAMFHETTTDTSGMTGMVMLDAVPVPAGTSVTFEAGGLHLMVEGAPDSLAAGDRVEIDLHFEHAGTIVVTAEVRQG